MYVHGICGLFCVGGDVVKLCGWACLLGSMGVYRKLRIRSPYGFTLPEVKMDRNGFHFSYEII